MNSSESDAFRKRMEETASLPPDDPLRFDFEREVAGNGTFDRRRWDELLDESRQLCEALADVPVPGGLQQRLLAIPDATAPAGRRPAGDRPRSRPIWPAWVAAAAVLVAAGVLLRWSPQRRSDLETVGLLAVNNHLNHREQQDLSVQTADAGELERALSPTLPFPVLTPELDPRFRLRGGRKCTLGAHPAALSLWKCGEREYSVFQFRRTDFGLQELHAARFVRLREPAGAGGTAFVWTRGPYGYVLVGDPEFSLEQLSAPIQNRRSP